MLNKNLSANIKKTIKLFSSMSLPISKRLITPFSTSFYQAFKSNYHRHSIFKSSNLKFRSNDISLIPFFFHPSILKGQLNPADQKSQFYHIINTPTFTLNFINDTAEEFVKQAWQNRKNITLNYRQALKITEITPFSDRTHIFNQSTEKDGNTYITSLTVADSSSTKQLLFILKQIKQKETGNQQEIAWKIDFSISYEDYSTFMEAIKTNILYISGVKFSLELTKQQALISANNSIRQNNKVTAAQTLKKPTKTNSYKIKRVNGQN